MKIGYARVSTTEQNLDLQNDALTSAGCEKIFTDTISGRVNERPGLDGAFNALRKGDTLVVWKLDRLGRTVKQLVDFVLELKDQGVEFQSITDGIDTSTSMGQFMFHIMAALAQMERDLISERTRAGLAAARKRGKVGGRPSKLTPAKRRNALQLLQTGNTYEDVAETVSVSVATLYRQLPASVVDTSICTER